MAFNDNFKKKVLEEEKKQIVMKNKIESIREAYENYEKGKITSKTLIFKFNQELGVQTSDKLERILNNSAHDNKDFRSVMRNLEILKDENTEYRQASSKIRNYDYNVKDNQEIRKKLKESKKNEFFIFLIKSD